MSCSIISTYICIICYKLYLCYGLCWDCRNTGGKCQQHVYTMTAGREMACINSRGVNTWMQLIALQCIQLIESRCIWIRIRIQLDASRMNPDLDPGCIQIRIPDESKCLSWMLPRLYIRLKWAKIT